MLIKRDMLDGHIFRQFREDIGLTREQAAEQLGVSVSTIRRRENAESIPIVDLLMLVEGHAKLKFDMIDKNGVVTPILP
jgi:transcriptional regulator with XRE-family HTH domain